MGVRTLVGASIALRSIRLDEIELVAGWLAEKRNYQWLDFGHGVQVLSAVTIRVMLQRDLHVLRVYAVDPGDAPIGIVALSNVDRTFRGATLWYVLGNKAYAGQGLTSHAASRLLDVAFHQLGLHAVSAWALEHNRPSIQVLKRNHFRQVGRLRQCHWIDGRVYDRFLFDLLVSEYRP